MTKFTKSEVKRSLLENITLMEKGDESIWVDFSEIESCLKLGYNISNEEKKQLYESITKPQNLTGSSDE